MWYVYDKTDDNHEYIFDLFEDVNCWVEAEIIFADSQNWRTK